MTYGWHALEGLRVPKLRLKSLTVYAITESGVVLLDQIIRYQKVRLPLVFSRMDADIQIRSLDSEFRETAPDVYR